MYEQLGPLRRMQLHSAAAEFVEDEGALLRHRVLAATPPNTELAAELEAFARREAAVGAWASAAWALVEGSNLSPNREAREQRLLLAVDATVGAGDLHQAEIFARDVASFSRGAWRDAALGYLAILRGRRDEAEELLGHAWRLSADDPDTSVAAVVAQRWGLHAVGRLRGDEVVRWSTRAIELARPGDPVRVEAEAVLGLGMGWQGQIAEGMTAYEELLGRVNAAEDGPQLERIRMAHGWLRMVRGDVAGARASLAMTAPAALRAGSVRIAVWAFSWLAYAEFVLGAWDEAAADAERAVSLLDESGMEWLRPLARYAAVLVPAARGRWEEAEEHLRAGAAQTGDYELMVVAAALARAEVAAARGEPEAVLHAMEPVLAIEPRAGVDEPGFWPWPDVFAEALISVGRLDEAEELLAPHEELAAGRGRAAMTARLGRVRGRLEAARGHLPHAEEAYQRALDALDGLPMPFERAQVELAYGQALRRGGQRRAAATQLQAARGRLADAAGRPVPRALRAGAARVRAHARQAQRLRPGQAHRAGAGGGPAGRGRDEQPAGGRGAVRQHQDGAVPPHAHLREARHQLPSRAGRSVPRVEGPTIEAAEPSLDHRQSDRSNSTETTSPATSPQNAAPMLNTDTSATVTTNVTSAPSVNRVPNAVTKAACSTRSMARPASTAMNAAGAASMSRVNTGANSPNPIASTPQHTPAVYWRARSPDAESKALVGPVRQVDTAPTVAASSDHTPQATVMALTGGSWPAARQHGDALPVLHHQHRDGERHHQLDEGLHGPRRGLPDRGGQPCVAARRRGRTGRSARRRRRRPATRR